MINRFLSFALPVPGRGSASPFVPAILLRRARALAVVALLSIASASAVRATVVVSDLNTTTVASNGIGTNCVAAQAFFTGASSVNLQVASVTMGVRLQSGASYDTGWRVVITPDVGNAPDLLHPFTFSAVNPTSATGPLDTTVLFNADGAVNLAAGTRYWLAVFTTSTSGLASGWRYTNFFSPVQTDGWSIDTASDSDIFSNNGGASYFIRSSPGVQFSITAVPVPAPEPLTWMMLLVGLVVISQVRKMRRLGAY